MTAFDDLVEKAARVMYERVPRIVGWTEASAETRSAWIKSAAAGLEAVGLPALLERVEAAELVPWEPEDGDTKCQRCHQSNACWFADNALWNEVMRDTGLEVEFGIVCLRCFAEFCEGRFPSPILHVSLTAHEADRDALAAKVARVEAVDERQIRNLGHVMEREQSNARFRDDGRTDERDVAAEAAIRWVLALLDADDPAAFRMDPRSYAEYRAALTEGTEGA